MMEQVLLIVSILVTMSMGITSCDKDGEGGEHGTENHDEEGEENGIQLGIDETYSDVRNGVRLVLAYDASSSSFIGTIENTISNTITQVRVEVHLSNGTELGPTTPVGLGSGETKNVTLSAAGESFVTWSAHAEVG